MKTLLSLSFLAVLLCVGCSTVKPLVTPSALTSEVATAVQVGLNVYPAAAPDVALARDAICAEATHGNTDPQLIVNDLRALGITNSNSKIIVNGALLVYEGVYALAGTNTATVQPYMDALCAGFTQGLPPAPAVPVARHTPAMLPPHLR